MQWRLSARRELKDIRIKSLNFRATGCLIVGIAGNSRHFLDKSPKFNYLASGMKVFELF